MSWLHPSNKRKSHARKGESSLAIWLKTAVVGSGWDSDANDNIRLELSLRTDQYHLAEGFGHALPEKQIITSTPRMPHLLNLPKRVKDWITFRCVFWAFLQALYVHPWVYPSKGSSQLQNNKKVESLRKVTSPTHRTGNPLVSRTTALKGLWVENICRVTVPKKPRSSSAMKPNDSPCSLPMIFERKSMLSPGLDHSKKIDSHWLCTCYTVRIQQICLTFRVALTETMRLLLEFTEHSSTSQ